MKVAGRRVSESGGDGPVGEFGGEGPFSLPADHVAAVQVPKGGSCCQNCVFVNAESHECTEPNYVAWNGGSPALPDLPLDEICSDWWTGASAPEDGPAAA